MVKNKRRKYRKSRAGRRYQVINMKSLSGLVHYCALNTNLLQISLPPHPCCNVGICPVPYQKLKISKPPALIPSKAPNGDASNTLGMTYEV